MSPVEFLTWLMSAGGIGLLTNYITQAAKNWLGWSDVPARVLSIAVSLALSTAAFFVLKYQWYEYIEEFWPVLVTWFTVAVGGWLVSQLNYRYMASKKNGS